MPDVNDRGFVRSGSPDGPLVVVGPEGSDFATEATLEQALANLVARYGGGKQVFTGTVTSSGDTTLITPGSGNAIRLFWVTAINDPDDSSTPLITIKLGASEVYRTYALAHWEVFVGAADESLVCNLDGAGDVAVTVHYEEFTP